jgi:di/tricarboxylate transporter
MSRYDMAGLGMFELAPVGIPIAIVGVAYLLTVGRRLIPDRGRPGDDADTFGLSPYLGELLVLEGAPVVGRTLAESAFGEEYDLNVLCVVRGEDRRAAGADVMLEAGDVLLVKGDREALLRIKNVRGLDLHPEVKFSYVESDDVGLAEVLLMPRSPLIGRTLRINRFRERFGLQVLAIARHGETLRTKLRDVRLNLGDVLLVQGPRNRLRALQDYETFRVLGAVEEKPPQVQYARRATTIFATSLVVAAAGLLELPVAVLLGAFVAFVTRCITPEEAWRSIEWKAILLIGSLLSLGVAMEETGTAQFLADWLVRVVDSGGPVWLLSAIFLLTVLLTQPMSNQAASIVILPIAVKAATQLGYDPRPFAVMVAVAASTSYITPLEPACLLVYGPGRYRFGDFVRVGAPLTLLVYAVAILIVPRIWHP